MNTSNMLSTSNVKLTEGFLIAAFDAHLSQDDIWEIQKLVEENAQDGKIYCKFPQLIMRTLRWRSFNILYIEQISVMQINIVDLKKDPLPPDSPNKVNFLLKLIDRLLVGEIFREAVKQLFDRFFNRDMRETPQSFELGNNYFIFISSLENIALANSMQRNVWSMDFMRSLLQEMVIGRSSKSRPPVHLNMSFLMNTISQGRNFPQHGMHGALSMKSKHLFHLESGSYLCLLGQYSGHKQAFIMNALKCQLHYESLHSLKRVSQVGHCAQNGDPLMIRPEHEPRKNPFNDESRKQKLFLRKRCFGSSNRSHGNQFTPSKLQIQDLRRSSLNVCGLPHHTKSFNRADVRFESLGCKPPTPPNRKQIRNRENSLLITGGNK